MDEIRRNIYEDKKQCFILKAGLQESRNHLKECSNKLIKDTVIKISDIRDLLADQAKNVGAISQQVNSSIGKLQVEIENVKAHVQKCQLKVLKCENDIGYHLLGNNSTEEIWGGYRGENTK